MKGVFKYFVCTKAKLKQVFKRMILVINGKPRTRLRKTNGNACPVVHHHWLWYWLKPIFSQSKNRNPIIFWLKTALTDGLNPSTSGYECSLETNSSSELFGIRNQVFLSLKLNSIKMVSTEYFSEILDIKRRFNSVGDEGVSEILDIMAYNL